MDIDRVVVRLMADATAYHRAMDMVESRLLGMANRLGFLGRSLEMPIKLAAAATIGLGTATAVASYQALKLATAYESAAISLEVMTGSAGRGKQMLDEINKLAVSTPFRVSDLLAGAGQLAAFGTEADQIIPTLKVLGEVASGVGIEKLPNIILAFGQVRAAGRLMGQELRQFINANIPLMEYLGKVRGVPTGAIKGMVERGDIGFGDVVAAFNKMVAAEGLYFGLNERRMQSVEGRWTSFTETLQIRLRDLGLAAFDVFKIADTLKSWTDSIGISDDAEENFNVARKFFQDVKDAMIFIVGLFKTAAHWTDKLISDAKRWASENEETVKKLLRIFATLAVILVTVKAVMLAFTVIGTILANWPILAIVAAVTALVVLMNQMEDFKDFGQSFVDGFGQALPLFKSLGEALRDAIFGEDWELAGKIIGKSLQLGWKMFATTMQVEMTVMLATFVSNIELGMAKIAAVANGWAEYAFDILDPAISKEEAVNRRNKRITDATVKAEKIHKDFMATTNVARAEELEKTLAPFRLEVEALRREAAERRHLREDRMWRAANPLEALIRDNVVDFEVSKMMRYQMFKEKKDKEIGVASVFWNSMTEKGKQDVFEEKFGAAIESQRVGKEVGLVLGYTSGQMISETLKRAATSQITEQLSVSPKAFRMSEHIREEMAEGKWAGKATDRFAKFQENFKLMNEALLGPVGARMKDPGPIGKLFMGAGRTMSPKEWEFGAFENYLNLRQALNIPQVKMPSVAFRGSQEAQDTINREQMEVQSVQDEIRQTLVASKMVQEQQRDYMRQVVEEMKKMNGFNKDGEWGGGADF
jgi:tape measure domain-containing protein